MKWIDFYKKEYLDAFKKADSLRSGNYNINELCSVYTQLVLQACELIKQFINYQGLFQYEERSVIKEAFHAGLIKDGEKWMNALTLALVYDSGEKEKFKDLIVSYCKNENFEIFNDLNKSFKKLAEEYGKNS